MINIQAGGNKLNITLHTPLTDGTRNLINAESLAKARKGVRIINCARGGLIVEEDLKAALESGHVGKPGKLGQRTLSVHGYHNHSALQRQ